MEGQASVNQSPPKNGPQQNQKRNARRKQHPQHSADIVFTKGTSIQTMPSLSKQLKGVTECIIGLQYVWEYRSPSKSVPPHYQCKLCAVSRLQHDMLAHVKGWKHSFRYLKKVHPDKVTCEEEEATKEPTVRKTIKEVAAEVEKTEGRGQLKVILKEPCEVPAFKGLRSAVPKVMPPQAPGMGLKGPSPFGPRFSDPRFHGQFPPQGGPLSDYPVGEYGESEFGGYSAREDFLDSGMDRRPFLDGIGHRPAGDGFGLGGGRDSYGRSGLLENPPPRMYPDEYQSSQMGSSLMDRPMDKSTERPGLIGAAPESSSPPNTLLTYLDSFRIENESDAQLVLKVTQKLTDVLMEYRLRSVSTGSSLNSLSMSSTSFSSTPSRLPNSSDRYSSSFSGPSRYSDVTPRYYK
ncbi:uncharacterized protein si:ch211-197h24.6 isoform X1 [Micropterus salmoides]|uniref:uncharacterized protein si:ch211-197h24.6 isoform X1 n=1 Tax=Micropterus salmoides TaxID=27706 RepID=UPI0018EBFBC4|nr:uncharacterized protein si:ch211-197h24.6 isoform X1 [Micropterus salmoides]XP_038567475.1 uncharacterized protein si:ch211-197h24.6 isoform X1 [Micropterus salmoides]